MRMTETIEFDKNDFDKNDKMTTIQKSGSPLVE